MRLDGAFPADLVIVECVEALTTIVALNGQTILFPPYTDAAAAAAAIGRPKRPGVNPAGNEGLPKGKAKSSSSEPTGGGGSYRTAVPPDSEFRFFSTLASGLLSQIERPAIATPDRGASASSQTTPADGRLSATGKKKRSRPTREPHPAAVAGGSPRENTEAVATEWARHRSSLLFSLASLLAAVKVKDVVKMRSSYVKIAFVRRHACD